MRSLLLILFVAVSMFSTAQDQVVYKFDNVSFMTSMPGAGRKKIERLAGLIDAYFSAIQNDQYDDWYAQFSASTIERVAPHKFPNKFRRMKEYGLNTSDIKIVSIKQLSAPFENEIGTEFEFVVDFGKDLNVSNRVSFDHLKRTDEVSNTRLMGFNVIASDKGYQICIHKYVSAKKGTGDGEN